MEPDVNVQSLLDKIKREGIEEAKQEAEKIIDKARSEAKIILETSRSQADSLLKEAQAEIEKQKESFEVTLSQAGRNFILGLKKDIIDLCNDILERQVGAALTSEAMQEIIIAMVGKWQMRESNAPLEVLVNEDDRQRLEDSLLASLHRELKNGIIIKPNKKIGAGFQIGEKEGNMHYDLTEKGIVEILSEFVSPRLAKILWGISGDGD